MLLWVLVLCLAPISWGDAGILQVLVQDARKQPVRGIEIGVEGSGGSRTSGDDGKVLLPLSKDIAENDWVSVQIIHSPPGKDLVMVSPYDGRTLVPSFKRKPDNFVRVIVIERGDYTALQDGTVVASLVAKINQANAPRQIAAQARQEDDPRVNLERVAKLYGLKPEDLDEAIRTWGAKTTDSYEAGLAALYERNYPKATDELREALRTREGKLAEDQKAVADAACFLGQSLYEQDKYRESATAYERCLQLFPNCGAILNNLALSLEAAGDYAQAETLYRRALSIDKKTLGPYHPDVATDLNNIATLLQDKGDYVEAERLLRLSLAIHEKALGPDHPSVAIDANNLGFLLEGKGDYEGAEPLFRRALAIDEKALGPDHPSVAKNLNNLGLLLDTEGDYARAEPLLRRAQAIDEKALGPDHPDVARDANNLCELLRDRGDYAAAEPLCRRAMAIVEKALGPDHPWVAMTLTNLGLLLEAKGDYMGAEPLFRRALAIDEKVLGPDHPSTRDARKDLKALQELAEKQNQK